MIVLSVLSMLKVFNRRYQLKIGIFPPFEFLWLAICNFDFFLSHTFLLLAHLRICGAKAHWLEWQVPIGICITSVMAR